MHPRVLIVGTVPYNKKSTSRAFESYFSGWEKENLAQIFSNTKTPCKGHCETLFQITDSRMLKRRLNKKVDTGVIYRYEDLPDEWTDTSLEVDSKVHTGLYKLGRKHSPLTHLGRKFVWRKKYWCTEKLNAWLDEFRPQCVFLSFSDDFFIPEIALYAAKRYNIPIVSSIGDDYYFNTKFSLNPIYLLYKYAYRRLIRKVFRHPGTAIYIGNKIRDKYNEAFGLRGETVYLTSEIPRRDFAPIRKENPSINYFGNITMGRNVSLNEIGLALGRIDPSYVLNVYSNTTDKEDVAVFDGNPNVCFHGSVPYSEVQKRTLESDLVVLVEGFTKKAIDITRYSLSTKAADSLASGGNIFVYGSMECGLIEYMASTGAAVCSDQSKLEDSLRRLLTDEAYQRELYEKAKIAAETNHILAQSTAIFRGVVRRAMEEYPHAAAE